MPSRGLCVEEVGCVLLLHLPCSESLRGRILARVGLGVSSPQLEMADFDLSNHRGWFYEQGHRGFKGEKGEPGLPGLDGLDAPCPLVWHFPPLPAWTVWATPRVWCSSVPPDLRALLSQLSLLLLRSVEPESRFLELWGLPATSPPCM